MNLTSLRQYHLQYIKNGHSKLELCYTSMESLYREKNSSLLVRFLSSKENKVL
jgi:hypothetical protein